MRRWNPLAVPTAVLVITAACAGDGHGVLDPLNGDPARFTWTLPAGWPAPSVPSDNPMSAAKVELGRRLFYDPRLSGNGSASCSSCHRQEFAFADAKNIPVGSTGEVHPRNSMAIGNVAYQRFFNWANLATPSLEAQALVPMFGDQPVELGLKGQESALLARLKSDSLYRTLFPRSFPQEAEPLSIANITRAIAAFQRTIISGDSPFDRFARGNRSALSAAAQRGETLFRSPRLKCAECHGGSLFTAAADISGSLPAAPPFFNNGLYAAYPAPNRGLFEGSGRSADMGRFKAPSLRNLVFTFPYMHDGSIASLSDVLDHYARGGRAIPLGPNAGDGSLNPNKDARVAGFVLSAQEKGDVIEFLKSLSDSGIVRNPNFSNPWPR
ncbi:MAG: MbnH family di-heme enzyme [Gemmatimonadaceae bacterium]